MDKTSLKIDITLIKYSLFCIHRDITENAIKLSTMNRSVTDIVIKLMRQYLPCIIIVST